METLLENPMPVLLIGMVVLAVLGGMLVTTRRGVLLAPIAVVLLLTLLGIVAERLVVTEREQAEQTLYDAAAAMEANDLSQIDRFIADGELRGRAHRYLGMVEFTDISLNNLEVGKINRLASPPTVTATFFGRAEGRDKTGMFPYTHYASEFQVELVLTPEGWKVREIYGDPDNRTIPEITR